MVQCKHRKCNVEFFQPMWSTVVVFDFYILFDRKGDIVNVIVTSAPVVFQVTSESPYTITLPISDPGALNGLRTVCNGDVLQIGAPSKGKIKLCSNYCNN